MRAKNAKPKGMPARVPDRELVVTDPDLERVDVAKLAYFRWTGERTPGKTKRALYERSVRMGPLAPVPEVDHWAMEEFAYHGAPGDLWQPMDAYLEFVGDRLSERGKGMLRNWTRARVGFYEIVKVGSRTAALREWDVAGRRHAGDPVEVVTPGIGGVSFYRGHEGELVLTYVAPWDTQTGLHCAMGYGSVMPKSDVGAWELVLNFRHPMLVATPYPWKTSGKERQRYLAEWRSREWVPWLAERLRFPFRGLLAMGSRVAEMQVNGLQLTDDETARRVGIYFLGTVGGKPAMVGATTVGPPDVASPNWMPMEEYRA